MKNPYKGLHDDVEIRIGKSTAWTCIFLFLLIITLPPVYRNILAISKGFVTSENSNPAAIPSGWVPVKELFNIQTGKGIVQHLKDFEDNLEEAPFTDPPRRLIQRALVNSPLREGNRKTRIGKEGWLYLQTALDALTGYGPIKAEPDSVAKDPSRKPWRAPLEAIRTFAGQLNELGVELILVPIPVKPMIYPEYIGEATTSPLTHPDAATFYEKISTLPNVEVIDLSDAFWKLKDSTRVFLKQDTHWTPAAMELAAETISKHIAAKPWHQPDHNFNPADRQTRQSLGDLVEKLDIGPGIFTLESVEVTPVTGKTRDQNSPIILLGDSFTNIYSDAIGLDWGTGAGLAEHLALRLGTPLDVIAINGGAATGVRQALAQRKGSMSMMKKKKVLVWTIAARDLMLSESGAQSAGVKWQDVQFNNEPASIGGQDRAKIRATLITKPELPDPKSTTYSTLLYAAEYRVDSVIEGSLEPEDEGKIAVIHYAFRNRIPQQSSAFQIGEQREFELIPFDSKKELQSLETRNESDLFDLYWDLTKPGPMNPKISSKPSIFAGLGCFLFTLILGAGVVRAARQ